MKINVAESKKPTARQLKHSFRAKLTVISGYISLLNDGSYGEVSSEMTRVFGIIQSSSDDLVQIASELLNNL